jgi:hypothetical protein
MASATAAPASRGGSLAGAASQDLALLSLASTASAELSFRRAESLLPCGLTQDELNELLGRCTQGAYGGQHEKHTAITTDSKTMGHSPPQQHYGPGTPAPSAK